jgi:hypothetical protein
VRLALHRARLPVAHRGARRLREATEIHQLAGGRVGVDHRSLAIRGDDAIGDRLQRAGVLACERGERAP